MIAKPSYASRAASTQKTQDERPASLLDDPHGFAMRLIRKSAHRLARRMDPRETSADDLVQEFSVDLIERLPRFDGRKAKLTTFLFRLLERERLDQLEKARTLKRRRRRDERALLGCEVQSQARRHRGTQGRVEADHFALGEDVRAAMASLSPRLQARCELLKTKAPTAISKELGIPLEAVMMDIADIRRQFEDLGLRDYLC